MSDLVDTSGEVAGTGKCAAGLIEARSPSEGKIDHTLGGAGNAPTRDERLALARQVSQMSDSRGQVARARGDVGSARILLTRKSKARKGKPDRYPIKPEIEQLLFTWVIGRSLLSDEDKAEIIEFLEDAKAKKLWIVCFCISEEGGEGYAILVPEIKKEKHGDEKVTKFRIRRHPILRRHATDCIFSRLKDRCQITTRKKVPTKPALHGQVQLLPIALDQIPTEILSSSANVLDEIGGKTHEKTSGQQQEKRMPSDQRLLLSILAAASLQFINSRATRALQGSALHAVLKDVPLGNGRTFTLADQFIIDPARPDEAISLRNSQLQEQWPPGSTPLLWVILLALDILPLDDGTTLLCLAPGDPNSAASYLLPFPLTRLARDEDTVRGPYVVILRAWTGPNGMLEVRGGFGEPVLSLDAWLGVDADTERRTARVCERFLNCLPEHIRSCVRIERRHFTLSSKDKVHVIPDFVVRIKFDEVEFLYFIETMGSLEAAYRARKVVEHEKYAEIAEVIPDERTSEADDDCSDSSLMSSLEDRVRIHWPEFSLGAALGVGSQGVPPHSHPSLPIRLALLVQRLRASVKHWVLRKLWRLQ